MPITQERLETLIAVSQALIDNADRAIENGKFFKDRIFQTNDLEELRTYAEELLGIVNTFAIIDRRLMEAFLEEKAHFKFNSKHNRQARENARRRRGRLEEMTQIGNLRREDPQPSNIPSEAEMLRLMEIEREKSKAEESKSEENGKIESRD
jgi:hypothetical protein